ncbi:MAG: hypothetical protein PHW69_03200 [Elusimicrobiaceae bacterium]|nr:hypothetical protein [Elusimicrobiaceae bacterium]
MTEAKVKTIELEQEIMDYSQDKYDLIVLGSMWAREIRRREEFRHKPNSEVISAALTDVLSGQISRELILDTYKKSLLARAQAREEREARKNAQPVEMTLPEL